MGCSPWDSKESDMTEHLHFHFSLSCIGEGHGNPLQCSCLENPRDGGAWWAAVYGVTQSWTRVKRLSSSSSSSSSRVSGIIVLTDNLLYLFLGAGSSALKRPFEDGLGDDKDPNKKMKRNLRKSV